MTMEDELEELEERSRAAKRRRALARAEETSEEPMVSLSLDDALLLAGAVLAVTIFVGACLLLKP